eukprot:6364458-Alexandrium_andersonii.AAC.1
MPPRPPSAWSSGPDSALTGGLSDCVQVLRHTDSGGARRPELRSVQQLASRPSRAKDCADCGLADCGLE